MPKAFTVCLLKNDVATIRLVFTIPYLICTGKKLTTRSSDRVRQHRNHGGFYPRCIGQNFGLAVTY